MKIIATIIIVFWISYIGALFAGLVEYRLPLAITLAGIAGLSEWLTK